MFRVPGVRDTSTALRKAVLAGKAVGDRATRQLPGNLDDFPSVGGLRSGAERPLCDPVPAAFPGKYP